MSSESEAFIWQPYVSMYTRGMGGKDRGCAAPG